MRSFSSLPSAVLAATLALLGTTPQTVRADDTDVYLTPNNSASAGLPKVMFDLDYRANLGNSLGSAETGARAYFATFTGTEYAHVQTYLATIGSGNMSSFDVLKMSLGVVFAEFENFEGGLMASHNHIASCAGPTKETNGCSNGAYVLKGFQEMDATGRTAWLAKFNPMKNPGGTLAHSYQLKEVLFEFFRYIKSYDVYNGRNGYMDWASTSGGNQNRNVGDPTDTTNNNHLLGWDDSTMTKVGTTWKYQNAFADGDKCTKLFFVHFMFGVTNQEDDSDTAIKKTNDSVNQGMGFTTLSNGTNGAIQMVSMLKNNDQSSTIDGSQSVTQYFVTDATSTSIGQLASAGGTSQVKITMSDPSLVVEALRNILREIISVSTTFVAASVPVNVFNRAESLDNVFIALFQVDADGKPSWTGNVKKLKFGDVTDATGKVIGKELQDALGKSAIGNDGRINYDALTYWTVKGDLPAPVTADNEVAERDGRVVDRGAGGQKIPGFRPGGTPTSPGADNATGNRQIYYDPTSVTNGTPAALTPLIASTTEAANTTLQTAIGTTDTTAMLKYLKYARGLDGCDADGDSVSDEVRSWIFGDPLHSRPLPVNYGLSGGHSKTNPLIYVAIGSNDGSMRFIRNSVTSGDDTDDAAGEEAWAFYPQATMKVLPVLCNNIAGSADQDSNGDVHPYAIDGAPTSLTIDINGDGTVSGSDKVYLFFGLRRGGRGLYAMDVTVPTDPKILWRITNATSGYSKLGLTFAQPRLGQVNKDLDGDGKAADYVLFVPGGYNVNKDVQDVVGTDDAYGNAFFVINAKTGELVWKAHGDSATASVSSSEYTHVDMDDAIPSEPAVIDSDGDGLTDRVVVGDTGGRVWRFDVAGSDSTKWRAIELGSVGRHHSSTLSNDLRFLHRPDVVPSRDSFGAFDAVVIGSGDRENPLDRTGDSLDADTPVNYMFMFKDRQTTPYTSAIADPTIVAADMLADVSADACITDATCGGTLNTGSVLADNDYANGWKLKFGAGPGEKSLAAPLTLVNTVFFTTFLPLGTYDNLVEDAEEATTCGPTEGQGAFYALNLTDATISKNFNIARDGQDPSTSTSRYTELASAGIPADVVGVSLDGQAYVLPPDLKLTKVDASTRWRTFWYEVESGDD